MTDDALQEMATGLATCAGPSSNSSAQGEGGMYEGFLAHAVRATASDCGLPSALSPLSLSTCMGAVSKMGEMSSCGDDDNDDEDHSNPRTAETCASDACAAFIASMTDDALQEMATGFATCTGMYAGYQGYGEGGTDGYLAHVVRKTASDCGLPSALSPLSLSTCMGAISK